MHRYKCDRLSLPRIIVSLAFAASGCLAQEASSDELAQLLATPGQRESAINAIRNSASDKTPLLLSWTTTPPRGIGVSQGELYIGLADAFGALKISAGIPFLLKYIGMNRTMGRPNIWLKSAEAILSQFPAVQALVLLGPAGSKAIVSTSWVGRSSEDRLRAFFAVAQISDPAARDFLTAGLRDAEMRDAEMQAYWAAEGLRRMGQR